MHEYLAHLYLSMWPVLQILLMQFGDTVLSCAIRDSITISRILWLVQDFSIVRSVYIANCWWCLKLRTKRNEIPSRSSIHNEECKRSHGCITSKTDFNHSIHKILHQIEERNRLCVWYTSKTSWSCLSSLFWRWVKKTIISLLVFLIQLKMILLYLLYL